MSRKIVSGVTGFLLFTCGMSCSAETLGGVLRAGNVPTNRFAVSELDGKITSYAISKDDPFLLAYYRDNGSQLLQPPLHIIRYDHTSGDLQRSDLRDVNALFQGEIPMDCLGSALFVREYHGLVYIDTQLNPSAGCLIVLSSRLAFRTALSGWLLGLIGADYAILRRSEIHFMSVHSMHIAVFDLKRNQSVEVYPYKNDPQRQQFSRLIAPLISKQWCEKYVAQCDPENFDVHPKNNVVVNEAAKVFGFEAQFDAEGFGDAASAHVPPRTVTYLFRERSGTWEHREFEELEFQRLFGRMSIEELVSQKPDLAFSRSAGQ